MGMSKINKNYKYFISLTIVGMLATATSFAQSYYDPYYYQNVGYVPYGYNNGYYDNYDYSNYYGYNNYSYNYPYDYNGNYYYNNYYNNGYYNNYNNGYYGYSLTPATYAATNATSNRGTINGYVTVSGNSYNNYAYSYGTAWFEYGTSPNYLDRKTNPANIYQSTSINSYLTNLQCGTTYYYRAVTQGQNGINYGTTLSFTTASCYNNYYSNYYPYNYNYNSYQNFDTHCGKNNRRW